MTQSVVVFDLGGVVFHWEPLTLLKQVMHAPLGKACGLFIPLKPVKNSLVWACSRLDAVLVSRAA